MLKNVKEYFRRTKRYKGIVKPPDPSVDYPLVNFLQNNLSREAKILEVGGGSGYLLKLFADKGYFNLFNGEIVPDVYQQTSPFIQLIGTDALNLSFRNDSFDCAIIKDLLHHLVGKTWKRSKLNAHRAIEELKRVVRDGGFIAVLELCNEDKLANFLLYHITKILAKINIGLPFIGLDKGVIASMLTQKEVLDLLVGKDVELLLQKVVKHNVLRRQKWTGLWRNIYSVLLIVKLHKNDDPYR
jgi:SAM-dependent methyltransferase